MNQASKMDNEIAIIGMSCKFPDAKNYKEFWENLINEKNSIKHIPEDRWSSEKQSNTQFKWAGILEDIWSFDHSFFNITPKEASMMDPQQRLLLEQVVHCMEDACLTEKTLKDYKTAVYVGAMTSDFLIRGIKHKYPVTPYTTLGNYHCILANRISSVFGFTGESATTNAACASSHAAIYQARLSILNGESDFAFVAGVNIICDSWKHESFGNAHMLSEDGQCKTFDNQANGYVPGEGVGVLLLCKASLAKEIKVPTQALIKGAAVNHNGASRSINAPSVQSQVEVIEKAIKNSGIPKSDISYIEAHGTGTSLGDPIEIEALRKVFDESPNENRYVGSVKSNIGHLEAAAGIAGIIKTCLMIKNKMIPKSLNIQQLNPIINFNEAYIKPSMALLSWESPYNTPRIAGVSSFGFGGQNGHILIEESLNETEEKAEPSKASLFVLSANTQHSLAILKERWRAYLSAAHKDQINILSTLTLHRASYKYRTGFVFENNKELLESLNVSESGYSQKKIHLSIHEYSKPFNVVEMSKALCEISPVFLYFFKKKQTIINRFLKQQKRNALGLANVRQFHLLYALTQTIVKISEGLLNGISGDNLGYVVGQCITGQITFRNALPVVYQSQNVLSHVYTSRTTIPFWNADKQKYTMPYAQIGTYWQKLVQNAIPKPEEKRKDLEKALLIYNHQRTFTNVVNLWLDKLDDKGEKLREVLEKNIAFKTLSHTEQIILLIGIRLGFDEINDRWQLGDTKEAFDTIREISFLLRLKVIEAKDILWFIINGVKSEVLTASLSKNWSKLERSLCPVLLNVLKQQKATKAIVIPTNISAFLESYKIKNDAEIICIGNSEDGLENKLKNKQLSLKLYLEMLLRIWKNGGDFNWKELFDFKSRPISGTPNYPFETFRHCLDDIEIAHEKIVPIIETEQPEVNLYTNSAVKLKDFIIQEIENETGILGNTIDENTDLADIGLNSSIILQLNQKLSNKIGPVPTTLFYQCKSIEDLLVFFEKNYQEKLMEIFPVNKKTEHIKEYKHQTIIKKATKVTETNLNQNTTDQNTTDQKDIAIIGISGRYPGAKNIEELWQLLERGNHSVTEVPEDRWAHEKFYTHGETAPGKVNAKWGGFLEDIYHFDPAAFGISPKDARFMSPQEKLFLEEAYQCIDNAGYMKQIRDKNNGCNNIGVFVGASYNDNQLYGQKQAYNTSWIPSNAQSYSVANRVSYYFDFRGPSIVIDTACSSSLYAIHLACESLRNGECEMAISGGVNTSLHPSKYQMLSAYHFLAEDGRCRAFGEGGTGYVPSEAVGTVLLKPLSKAIADNDTIYAVIKSSAVSHGGKTHGYTIPNPKEQSRAIFTALEKANINPETISYVEAHGTGTSLGDPIEISGLTSAYSNYTKKKEYCAIGSIKSNIGHAEAAAGIAQITKVVLQMKSGLLTPSLLHSDRLNPNISFNQTPFYVQLKTEKWKEGTSPKRAGVSSFGAGGVNVHMIMEAYEKEHQLPRQPESNLVFTLSADSNAQLKLQIEGVSGYLKRCINNHTFLNRFTVEELSNTLINHKIEKKCRIAFMAKSLEEVVTTLDYILEHFSPKKLSKNKIYFFDQEISIFSNNNDIENQEILQILESQKSITSLMKLWVLGACVNWNSMYPELTSSQPIYLPPYPFNKQYMGYLEIEEEVMPLNSSKETHKVSDVSSTLVNIKEGVAKKNEEKNAVLDVLFSLPESFRQQHIEEELAIKLAEVLGYNTPKEVPKDIGFFEMGVESIQLKTLQEDILKKFQVSLPETTFFEYSTISSLAEKILESIEFDAVKAEIVPNESEEKISHSGSISIEQYSLNEIELLDINELGKLLEQETKEL